MPNIAKPYCDIHNIEKFKDNNNRNVCRLCRYEKKKIYIEKNKESIRKKNQEYSKRTRERAKAWLNEDRKKNPERYKSYAAKYNGMNVYERTTKRIVSKYGLSVAEYNQLVVDCNNRCNICGLEETRKYLGEKRRLCLDHDHDTGKIRGLLCFACNIALGKFEDDPIRLQSAIDYLKKHECYNEKQGQINGHGWFHQWSQADVRYNKHERFF